jgi:hypothetical protein
VSNPIGESSLNLVTLTLLKFCLSIPVETDSKKSLVPRRGNCKNVTLGLGCEIGLRKKTYNVLAGSVLSVWTQLEAVLTHDGNKKGTTTRMQVSLGFIFPGK